MLWLIFLVVLLASPAWAIEEFVGVTWQSGAIANGSGATVPVTHYGTAGVDVSISNTATVTFQGRSAASHTYKDVRCLNTATGAVSTTATATGNYQCPIAGLIDFKAPITNCSSCVVSVSGQLTTATIAGLASLSVAGADGAVLDGDNAAIKATVKDYTNSNPLAVVLTDTNGDPATSSSFDGILRDGAGDTTQANVSSGRLHVDGSGVTQPVSGTVTVTDGAGALNVIVDSGSITANAGTNLNTSLLALESGGNLATIAGVVDATASTVPANALVVGGTDGTNTRMLKTNTAGELQVDVLTLPSVTIGTFPDNEPFNVAQINGVTPLMGAGNTGTGSPRVTIATDQAALPGLGIYVEDIGETAGGNLAMAGSVRRDVAASSAGTTGDNATVNTDANGLLWTRTIDPCTAVGKTFLAINISTAATTEITPSLAGASTNYYVCSLVLVTAAANNVALVDDDTDDCASVTSGLAGGTTAASGFNLAGNSGLTFGNGMGSVFKTNGANRVICLVTSAATQLSGTMAVVAAP